MDGLPACQPAGPAWSAVSPQEQRLGAARPAPAGAGGPTAPPRRDVLAAAAPSPATRPQHAAKRLKVSDAAEPTTNRPAPPPPLPPPPPPPPPPPHGDPPPVYLGAQQLQLLGWLQQQRHLGHQQLHQLRQLQQQYRLMQQHQQQMRLRQHHGHQRQQQQQQQYDRLRQDKQQQNEHLGQPPHEIQQMQHLTKQEQPPLSQNENKQQEKTQQQILDLEQQYQMRQRLQQQRQQQKQHLQQQQQHIGLESEHRSQQQHQQQHQQQEQRHEQQEYEQQQKQLLQQQQRQLHLQQQQQHHQHQHQHQQLRLEYECQVQQRPRQSTVRCEPHQVSPPPRTPHVIPERTSEPAVLYPRCVMPTVGVIDGPAPGARVTGVPAVGARVTGGPVSEARMAGEPALGARVTGVPAPGARVTGGLAPGARVTGGLAPGARVTGGLAPGAPVTGGLAPGARVTGGLAPGARVTGGPAPGARVTGGPAPGARTTGGPVPGARTTGGSAPGAIEAGPAGRGADTGVTPFSDGPRTSVANTVVARMAETLLQQMARTRDESAAPRPGARSDSAPPDRRTAQSGSAPPAPPPTASPSPSPTAVSSPPAESGAISAAAPPAADPSASASTSSSSTTSSSASSSASTTSSSASSSASTTTTGTAASATTKSSPAPKSDPAADGEPPAPLFTVELTAAAVEACCRGRSAGGVANLNMAGDRAPPAAARPAPAASAVLRRDQLPQRTPSVLVGSRRQAHSPQLQEFCLKNPVAVVRGIAAACSLDLGLFSTKTLVEAHPDHAVEVRNQLMQSSDENWDPTFTRKVWGCVSSRSHTSIARYAQYQAMTFTDSLKLEGQEARPTSHRETDSDPRDSFAKYQSLGQKRGHKTIKFGTNVDLSDEKKWRTQLQELNKLPAFCRVVSAGNMLSHVGHPILGMNTVQLYMKVPGSRTPGHQENNNFCSININIGPDDCEWFGVPDSYWGVINSLCEKNGISYLHGSWWPDMEELLDHGVPVYRFLQRPGDLVWVNTGCVHWVQAAGWCNNIAWNVGPLTARQHRLAVERYEWNKTQKYKSIVPMQHLSWNLARNIRVSDPDLHASVRMVLLQGLRQVLLTTELAHSCDIPIRFHGRGKNESSHYCDTCDLEVFNVLFVKENEKRKVVYCVDCAYRQSAKLVGFVCLEEYPLDELKEVYDDFILHVPSLAEPA